MHGRLLFFGGYRQPTQAQPGREHSDAASVSDSCAGWLRRTEDGKVSDRRATDLLSLQVKKSRGDYFGPAFARAYAPKSRKLRILKVPGRQGETGIQHTPSLAGFNREQN